MSSGVHDAGARRRLRNCADERSRSARNALLLMIVGIISTGITGPGRQILSPASIRETSMSRACLLLASSIGLSCLPVCEGAERTRSPITFHVLDTQQGKPAAGLSVAFERCRWESQARSEQGMTGADGRIETLLPKDKPLAAGVYRLTFDSGRTSPTTR